MLQEGGPVGKKGIRYSLSRPRTASDFPSHQTVTDRRPTGLTVTFPALLTARQNVARHRGDSESLLGLNRRDLVQLFVSLAHKRDPELSYLRHIASVHV